MYSLLSLPLSVVHGKTLFSYSFKHKLTTPTHRPLISYPLPSPSVSHSPLHLVCGKCSRPQSLDLLFSLTTPTSLYYDVFHKTLSLPGIINNLTRVRLPTPFYISPLDPPVSTLCDSFHSTMVSSSQDVHPDTVGLLLGRIVENI